MAREDENRQGACANVCVVGGSVALSLLPGLSRAGAYTPRGLLRAARYWHSVRCYARATRCPVLTCRTVRRMSGT
eukprot:1264681-Rhodomonas_salina.1